MHPLLIYIPPDKPNDLTVRDGGLISWKASTCATDSISYRVEITRLNDSVSVDVILSTDTEIEVSTLEPNQDYVVSVTAIGSTCSTDTATQTFTFVADGENYYYGNN